MSLVRFRPEAPNKRRTILRFICGCSSSGRAPPCQGGGSGFEPRHPLHEKTLLSDDKSVFSMVSVPDGTGDIPFGMISASQGIYACGICRNGYYITFLLSKNISYGISRISYCVSNISFNGWGLFMSENKLRTLSFEFAVVVVNIVDSVKIPKSSKVFFQWYPFLTERVIYLSE